MPQNIVTWMNAKEYVNYDDFSDEYYSPPDYNYNFYDYNIDGITGANVLSEMRPKPTHSSFTNGIK